MTNLKKIGVLAVSAIMSLTSVFAMTSCGSEDVPPEEENPKEEIYYIPKTLDFEEQVKADSWTYVKDSFGEFVDVGYYTVDRVVYCTNPTNPGEQALRFYVPEDYLNKDGTLNVENEVNGYTAETAPIIYLNNLSGYVGEAPWTMDNRARKAATNKNYNTGWYLNYLLNGFVLVFAGERGKQSVDADGGVTGVAPYSVVDLKAGIRFLKHNVGKFPGDPNKIISNGVSAGGEMSALLGVTGNTNEYDELFEEMGAYVGEDADDSIFATQAYCPITDLDHAALAYEWFWPTIGNTNAFVNALGAEMRKNYANYVNGLNLVDENGTALTINETSDGTKTGTFVEWLTAQYEASYEHYVELNGDTDSAGYSWLSYADGEANISSLDDMLNTKITVNGRETTYIPIGKSFGSFDPLSKEGDNAIFGLYGAKFGSKDGVKHFTASMLDCLEPLKTLYPDDYRTYYDSYYPEVTDEEIVKRVAQYNPYNYVNDKNTVNSEHFRICVGTVDANTSPTVSAIYALLLMNAGYDVNYNLMWNEPHYDADFANEFESWVNKICKAVNEEEGDETL